MTYLRALSNQYGAWRSQALVYFTVFVVGTNVAITLEVRAGKPPLQVLVLTCLVTGGLILVLPLLQWFVVVLFAAARGPFDTNDKMVYGERGARHGAVSHEVRKSKWASTYADYCEQAERVISEVKRANISPQTKTVLVRLLCLLAIDRSRMPAANERDFYFNEGTYMALLPIYSEFEEILLAAGIESYGGIPERTKHEKPTTQEPKTHEQPKP